MSSILDSHRLKQMYQKMLRIRLFEEKVDRLFVKGMLPGAVHTCIGQEPVPTELGRGS